MDMQKLDEALAKCLENRNPVLLTAVVVAALKALSILWKAF